MKYVIIRQVLISHDKHGTHVLNQDVPFPFQECITHSVFAEALINAKATMWPAADTVECISAGFVRHDGVRFNCSGGSESLKLKSRPHEDSVLMNSFEYTHGLSDREE